VNTSVIAHSTTNPFSVNNESVLQRNQREINVPEKSTLQQIPKLTREESINEQEIEGTNKKVNVPQWMIKVLQFRQELFLQIIEPIIVIILGPVDPSLPFSPHYEKAQSMLIDDNYPGTQNKTGNMMGEVQYQLSNGKVTNNELNFDASGEGRRLSYLPDFVQNKLSDASYFQETSMSFATFTMLFFIMNCVLMIFLNCFYHNQKTSPLFISPRRHRLPKLVPPPLPVNGFFSWVSPLFISSIKCVYFMKRHHNSLYYLLYESDQNYFVHFR